MKELEYPNIEAAELILSNGMRICYKCTDFLDDQVRILVGISYQVYHNTYFLNSDQLLYHYDYSID